MDQEEEEEGEGEGEGEGGREAIATKNKNSSSGLLELPDAVLTQIFSLVSDVRSRNSLSLSCLRFRHLERSTRLHLSLRGNIRDLFLLPNSFHSVRHLDLSLLSPWGHPFLHHHSDAADTHSNQEQDELVALRLRRAFPDLLSLTVYARNPSTLSALAPRWGPTLRHASLVRWHQRPPLPPGADLLPLLSSCPNLSSLDLSRFYCWSEDLPAALLAHPASAASLTSLNLLNPASVDGFRSSELTSVADACPNLAHLLVPCVFDPRCFGFVDDDALLRVASSCPGLVQLHLADPATLSVRTNYDNQEEEELQQQQQDSRITCSGLERLFSALPKLEDFALDLYHNDVRDAGSALEVLGNRCPRMKRLQVGRFRGICRAAGLHLDGVAVCGGLQSLCIKNSPDLTDAGLVCIARGCRRLSRLDLHGCGGITATGIKKMAGMLRSTLVDVSISRCRQMDAAASIGALEPIRDRIERLHVDCIWTTGQGLVDSNSSLDVDELDTDDNGDDGGNGCCSSNSQNKKCRYSDEWNDHHHMSNGNMDGFWHRTWGRLRYLSLWLPAGVQLSPLPNAGLGDCPELEEVCIKIEGNCRGRPAEEVFGLSCLALYPKLSKMKLDCGDATGYALTAPSGQMDLSLWERFYLYGIERLNLYELDYWPPQDRDVNQRSLSLPATGLIRGCLTLRKLFIHGTMHEHFMMFFLGMPRLRDVQLREDYYPAPENDMSTEMRVDSCSRFEDKLNSRAIPD